MLTSVSSYDSEQIGQGWVLAYDTGHATTVRSRVRTGADNPLTQYETIINDLCLAHLQLLADKELLEEQLTSSERKLTALRAHAESDPLYALKMHETLDTDEHTITRVPGGWIYWNIAAANSVFVPYNNEFQSKNPA